MARKKKVNDYGTGIPVHEVDALARILLPKISLFRERGRTGRTAGVCRVEGTTGTRQGIRYNKFRKIEKRTKEDMVCSPLVE